MSTEIRPAHSTLGASGAERWMNCPGSIALLKALTIPETSDEPDYRTHGTAAHEMIEVALRRQQDAWELMGEKFNGVEVDQEMQLAGQIYLDRCRGLMVPGAQVFIEQSIEARDFHDLFYGTVDCAVVDGDTLYVNDFKYGEGIMVDVEDNPQIMYYAFGILRNLPAVTKVVCAIIQPRGFHHDGPVRVWETSADYIRSWAETKLLPAMLRTEFDNSLDAGDWCRFCPAKLLCPLMVSLFGAAANADPRMAVNLSDDALGRDYPYAKAVKHYLKALEGEVFRRLQLGQTVPGTKLVWQKANRVWKPGAIPALKKKYGADVMTTPVMKSPAEVEKIDGSAKKLVNEWAYTPQTGLTVAPESDGRPAQHVKTTAEAFPNAVALAEQGGDE